MAPAEAHRLRALMIIHMDTSTGGLHFPPSLKQWKLLRLHFPEKVGGHGCLSTAWVAFHHPSAGRECRQLWPVLFAQRFHLECMVLPKFTGNRNVTVIPGLCCLVWGFGLTRGCGGWHGWLGLSSVSQSGPSWEESKQRDSFYSGHSSLLLSSFISQQLLQSRNLLCRVIGSCWHWHKKV